jgi:hypothetical protein
MESKCRACDTCPIDITTWRGSCLQYEKEDDVETARDVGYWRDIIAAEYEDLPELSVTLPQAMRLWSLDEATCRCVLDSFIASGYLFRTSAGQYRRAADAPAAARAGAPRS